MSAEHDATELQNEVYRLEARVAELEAERETMQAVIDRLAGIADGFRAERDALSAQPQEARDAEMDAIRRRAVAATWLSLKTSERKLLMSRFGVVCQQGKESDLAWSVRALEAMAARPECIAAILAAKEKK